MRSIPIGCVLAIATAPVFVVWSAHADDLLLAGSNRSTAMLQRPLFSPTRRPPPPVKPFVADPIKAVELQAAVPNVFLSGIILGNGHGIALLHRPQDQSAVRVPLGGEIDGWTVAEIRPRALVLRQGERSVTVEMPTPAR